MIKFKISNFLGIKKAEIKHDKLTIVMGKNFSAKTSTAKGVAAAITGQTIPFPKEDVKKKDSGLLIHNFEKKGSVEILDESNEKLLELSYPSCKRKTFGGAIPDASPIAMGLERFSDKSLKDRKEFLIELLGEGDQEKAKGLLLETLKDLPPDKMPDPENKEADIDIPVSSSVWDLITDHSWDEVHSNYKSMITSNTGAWKQVAGEVYGYKKAEGWVPDGWDEALEGSTEEELNELISLADNALVNTIKAETLSEGEVQRLIEEAAPLVELEKEKVQQEKVFDATTETLKKIKANDPGRPELSYQNCPECNEPLKIEEGMIVRGEINITPKQKDKQNKEHEDAQIKIKEQKTTLKNVANKLAEITQQVRVAEAAKNKIDEINQEAEGKSNTGMTREHAQAKLNEAIHNLRMFKNKIAANEIHEKIKTYEAIKDATGESGVRAELLSDLLKPVNDELANMVRNILKEGFAKIKIENDMSIRLGPIPYALLSGSQKYIVDTCIQSVVASYDGSEMILLDGADICLPSLRSALLGELMTKEQSIIMFASMRPEEQRPPSDPGSGRHCYWIEDGKVEEVS
jgi:hypothetical protein